MNRFFSTLTLITGTSLTILLTSIVPSQFTKSIPLKVMNNNMALAETSIDLTTLNSTSLTSHNGYRATHSSPDMTNSDALNQSSQTWAENIASSGKFEHSTNRGDVGENLYAYYTTADSIGADVLATQAVQSWYNEVSAYDYNNPQFSKKTGHFTQVVWKGSIELGCGAAQGTKVIKGKEYKAFYVVCQYSPAGNVKGAFADNVLKP